MSLATTTRRALFGSLCVAALLAATTLTAQAETGNYVNGGVGKAEQAQMHATARDWPLRMTFSQNKDNEFVPNVNVQVRNHRGVQVFSLQNAGPLLYVNLPAGKYRVNAMLHGVTQARDVTLGSAKGTDIYFHWKGTQGPG